MSYEGLENTESCSHLLSSYPYTCDHEVGILTSQWL